MFAGKGLKEKSIYGYLDWCLTSIFQPQMETMLVSQFQAFAGRTYLLGAIRRKCNESDTRWRFSAPRHITVPFAGADCAAPQVIPEK